MTTADDFGLSKEVNEAVEVAHRKGVLAAASLMVAGPAAEDAVARARRLPRLRVGLHLVLVDGPSALAPRQIPDLVGPQGRLRRDMVGLAFDLAVRPSLRRQIEKEMAAQFWAFSKTGLVLDHVNAHKHFHVHPMVADRLFAIGAANGMRALRVPREPLSVLAAVEGPGGRLRPPDVIVPWAALLYRRALRSGLCVPDAVFGLRWSGRMTRQRVFGLLKHLPPGLVEIYMHPATTDRFPGSAPGYGYAEDLAALTDPDVIALLRRSVCRIGGYRDACP